MKHIFLLIIVSGFCILSNNLWADDSQPQSWKLSADRTAASHDNQVIEAFGNVILERGQDYIRAEYARYYQTTKWVYLKGDIKAKIQGDFMNSEEAEFDLNTNQGWLKNGQVFLEDPHMYFEGELLKRTGPETYEFREATVTVCDGDRPAWSIKSSRGDITKDGYAHLWTPKFQILDQPVFASPYAVIPVKTKRQSGFLLPEAGSSDRLGVFYNQPYYQVIDEEQDATVYSNFMASKGLMLGAEYRQSPDIHTKGIWRIDFLNDISANGDSLYIATMDRENTSRWWARGKYDGYIGDPELSFKMDLDLVSDADYLREFKSGYSGYKSSRKDFLQYFGRDIEDNDSMLRVNRALLTYNWAQVGVQSLLEYTQNLEYGTNSQLANHRRSDDPTLQRLPEIDVHLYQTKLASTPFNIEGSSQFASFWREFGTTGTRVDIHPILSLPVHSDYGSIIPKVGWRGTGYFIEKYENELSDVDQDERTRTRSLPDISATAYTEFAKVFSVNELSDLPQDGSESKLLRMKHAIQPRLEYNYIPFKDQSSYPYFDEIDRIKPRNELRYSLSNILTTKTGRYAPDPTQQGTKASHFDYLEVMRLKVEQDYDYREASRNNELDTYDRRPFSDVLFDLTTSVTPWLAVHNKSWYSPYENRITEHEHGLSLFWPEQGFVYFGLDFVDDIDEYKRQAQEEMQIANFGGAYYFTHQWSAGFLYRVDYENSMDLEKRLSLRYDHQCFSTAVDWSQTDTDSRFEFRLILAQLGSIGR